MARLHPRPLVVTREFAFAQRLYEPRESDGIGRS